MAYPKVSDDPRIQSHYEHCRAQGTGHALAEMFALQQPPMSNSDREFLHGFGANGGQFENQDYVADHYKRIANAAGVSTTGKVYLGSLADHPGDPKAWVSGRGDVQRVCEERGWGCEGAVKVKATLRREKPNVAVADDILENLADRAVEKDPGLARKDRGELKHELKQKHKHPSAKG